MFKYSFLLLLCLALTAYGFSPIAPRQQQTTLQMGLFDFLQPKKDGEKSNKKEGEGGGFLEGKGAKITVREDEDNAMWVEEPKTNKKKK